MRSMDWTACVQEGPADAWLVYDFRGSNPVFATLLGGPKWTTRRAAICIPRSGEPYLIASRIDLPSFNGVDLPIRSYTGWRELHALLSEVAGLGTVAMEYSPGCALPATSFADAGIVELMRTLGATIVSSADLIQRTAAAWNDASVASHLRAVKVVNKALDIALELVRTIHRSGAVVFEHSVVDAIMQQFEAAGLEACEPPIVAVNGNAGDPHYAPCAERPVQIREGDWILIDLWAREPIPEGVFGDVTWVGFVGEKPPEEIQQAFNAVIEARDAAVTLAQSRWSAGEAVCGWELDQAARTVLESAGYGSMIKTRTGHSLSPGAQIHGLGFNLDDFESHDDRRMLPRLGFTVEPGVYNDRFGVRSEINLFVDPLKGPIVTTRLQTAIELLV